MRCHIIVSLESIECVESQRWPIKNAGAKLREYGARQKDRPIAATLKRKLLTKGKRGGGRKTLFGCVCSVRPHPEEARKPVSKDEWHEPGLMVETALRLQLPRKLSAGASLFR